MKEVLVAYKVLSNNEIDNARISVPMAIAMAKDLLSENQSDFALVNVETMLTALENLKSRIYLPGSATFSEPEAQNSINTPASKSEPKRNWFGVDLSLVKTILFRHWLMNEGIKFETSGNGELTHFEVFCSDKELDAANNELDRICSIVGTL